MRHWVSASGTPLSVTEGQAFFGVVAHFTDADPAGVLSDYSATIDWGDGNFSQGTIVTHSGGGFDVTGTNTYAGRGPYTTTVQIHDQGGSAATVNGAVTVTVPLPFVSIVATQANANVSGVTGLFTVPKSLLMTRGPAAVRTVAVNAAELPEFRFAAHAAVIFPPYAASPWCWPKPWIPAVAWLPGTGSVVWDSPLIVSIAVLSMLIDV